MAKIDAFFNLMFEQKASDLHLSSGNNPMLRINGELHRVEHAPLDSDALKTMLYEIAPEYKIKTFEETGDVDFGYEIPNISRFRANFFNQKNGIGAVFRQIPSKVLSFDDFEKFDAPLPPVLKKMAMLHKGLVIVTGPTGSGKSTTLAAMIDFINNERKGHVVTIEDPVEYVHTQKNCLFSQREVGTHVPSFSRALLSGLREDPDVILVGEMRDAETIHLAITAAEIGILVFATLHTNGAAASIDRIINAFPAGEEPYVRTMLSTSLIGIVSQELVRRTDGKGRLPAVEIMINNAAISNLIRENKIDQIENVIQSGGMQGMQRMDTALHRLLDANLITIEEAYSTARNKAEFEKLYEARGGLQTPGGAEQTTDSVNITS